MLTTLPKCLRLSTVHGVCCLQGQPMNCVYFVMSGAVEILRSATQEDVEREFSGNTSIEHSFTVDIDESLMLDCSVVGDGMMPIGAVNGRLHIDRLKVCATLMLRGDPTPLLAGCGTFHRALLPVL